MTQTQKYKVPALRFPEFQGAGEWEEKRIGDIFKITRGDVLSMKLVSDNPSNDSPYPVYSSQTKSNGLAGYYSNYLYEDAITWTTDGANAGDVKKRKGKFYCTNVCGVLLSEKGYANSFVAEILNTKTRNHVSFVGNPKLMNGVMGKIQIPLPTLPEQQKIADCLSSLDDLITAQAQKLDTLKTHKKGMMQQLFPAEGETVPKRRFPEFQGAGDWEEMPLKKVFSIFQGFAFSSKDSVKNGVRWLKIADVSIQEMNHSTPSYLPNEHKDKHEKFSVKQGDYVIALTRPILSKQLKMAPVDKVFHGALLNQRVGRLVTTQNIEFIYFLLQTLKVISDIEESISGSEPPNLSVQQIDDIKTYIPSSSKEQQKIATCLTSLDDLITGQAQKLAHLKTHKKGLMQQLFPTAKEAI